MYIATEIKCAFLVAFIAYFVGGEITFNSRGRCKGGKIKSCSVRLYNSSISSLAFFVEIKNSMHRRRYATHEWTGTLRNQWLMHTALAVLGVKPWEYHWISIAACVLLQISPHGSPFTVSLRSKQWLLNWCHSQFEPKKHKKRTLYKTRSLWLPEPGERGKNS